MQIELGNVAPIAAVNEPAPNAPRVTYVSVPNHYTFEPADDVDAFVTDLKAHYLETLSTGVTRRPDHEALVTVTHPTQGMWSAHSSEKPAWVWSDDPHMEEVLAAFYGCPTGRPEGVEDTHHTIAGPPGVVPGAVLDFKMLLPNAGRDSWYNSFAGGTLAAGGVYGQATAVSGTTLTTAYTTGSTTQFNGYRLVATASATKILWGNVQSCTSGANSVITVDAWYDDEALTAVSGSNPSSTATWAVFAGNTSPFQFCGISANNSAASQSDTSLTGEITTSGGGLVRKQCAAAHTAGTNTFTLTVTFTANSSDSLSVIIARAAFRGLVVSATVQMMGWDDAVSPTATLSASGDALTLTLTVTGT